MAEMLAKVPEGSDGVNDAQSVGVRVTHLLLGVRRPW